MIRLATFLKRNLGDVGVVFYTSLLIITAFVVTSALEPEAVEAVAQKVLAATAQNVGWMYLMATTGFVLFILGKRIKWLILPLHESETDRHLIGLSG